MTALRPIDPSAVSAPETVTAGAAPMLQWIEIKLLVVDDSYQRAPHLRVIERIAREFDWRKFSTVLVAPIEGGQFAVIDGQHRSHAAAACGIERVPCQVTIMDRAEQARAFAAINGVATRVHATGLFKAAVAAGEVWAVEIRDVCQKAGCRALTANRDKVSRKPGDVMAVGWLRDIVRRRGGPIVTDALRIVRTAPEIGEDVELYDVGILRALVEAIASRPHLLARGPEVAAAIAELDPFEAAVQAAHRVAARRRANLTSMTRTDMLESIVGDALDKALPQRSALLAPRAQMEGAHP